MILFGRLICEEERLNRRLPITRSTSEVAARCSSSSSSSRVSRPSCDRLHCCFDFIVTPEGRHVFLESNPRGQYLWIEHYTSMPITEAIADALMAAI